jgi:cell division protease FtsH
MDGFKELSNVVVIAATNRVNMLDDALLRSGRFDTKIKVELPNEEERTGIMLIHLKKKKHDLNENKVKEISKKT